MATGPDFEAGGEIDRISILDIASTILAAHGVAVPTDMDGTVIPILAGDAAVGERDPIALDRRAGGDEQTTVEKRLQQLGYMESSTVGRRWVSNASLAILRTFEQLDLSSPGTASTPR